MTSPLPTYFSGRVHSIVFEDLSKAFYILKMSLDEEEEAPEESLFGTPDGESAFKGAASSFGQTTTVRGDVPGLSVGINTWFGFEAVWDNHPTYGRQLRITRAPVFKKTWDASTCVKILVSNGIGRTVADKLRALYGEDLAEALRDEAKILAVPGMTKFTAEHIHLRWQAARAHFLSLEFLNGLDLPQGRVRQIWSTFGDTAQAVLSDNPWALLRLEGMKFHDADSVANRLGLDTSASNLKRVEGAVLHACRSGRGFGHLFSSSGEVLTVVRSIDADFKDEDVAKAIKSLVTQSPTQLVVDRTTREGVKAIYDPWSYKIEQDGAALLLERAHKAKIRTELEAVYARSLTGNSEARSLRDAVEQFLGQYAKMGAISLSPTQTNGVRNALCESVSIITGLPGTGKTTSLKVAVLLMQEAGIPFLIVAPTGIAAKRLESVTGAKASTIHRAFKSQGNSDSKREATYAGVVGDSEGPSGGDGSQEEWGYGPGNPHPAEVIIVDESSMVDQHLLYRIVTCTRPDARLVFVGDAAQLPSVGPGNVLRDMIASKLFPTVALTEIFRQKDTSPIIHAAHAIYRGDVPEAPRGSDFSLVEVSDEEKISDLIVNAAKKLFDLHQYSFQVLSPRHNGTVGVTSLNAKLREVINPKRDGLLEMKLGPEVIREDDRIMVVKNNYQLGVYNGDVGKVATIDRKGKQVKIKIHGPPVLEVYIPFALVPSLLRLAYAVTVHKSQGQEWDIIIMPVVDSFAHQLQRNLLYTAVTRARKRVVLIGTRSALIRAVANERESARNTLLRDRLLALSKTQAP